MDELWGKLGLIPSALSSFHRFMSSPLLFFQAISPHSTFLFLADGHFPRLVTFAMTYCGTQMISCYVRVNELLAIQGIQKKPPTRRPCVGPFCRQTTAEIASLWTLQSKSKSLLSQCIFAPFVPFFPSHIVALRGEKPTTGSLFTSPAVCLHPGARV